jgi:pentatricopeptide repeat protein
MNNSKVKKICNTLVENHINRMHELCDNGRVKDAESVYSEIREWVIHKDNLKVLSLEYMSEYFADF